MDQQITAEKKKAFFHTLYEKVVKINDTPQRVALGFGVGIFIGNLPGVGPITALLVAALLRINKAAALIGALLINTWFGFVTLVLSIQIGCAIMGIEWHTVHAKFLVLIKHFHFSVLFKESARNIILPFLLGQLVISFVLGIIAYLAALFVIYELRMRKAKLLIILMALILPLGAFAADTGNTKIIASFYPVYIMAKNVVKDVPGVELTDLTPAATGCLHDYALTAFDMKKIAGAQIFIVNGAGMEPFLERVAGQYPGLKVISLSDGINLIKTPDGVNAHVWVSISGAIQEVKNLADGLVKQDPAHAVLYRKNAEDYLTKLGALKEKMHAVLDSYKGREIITFHEAFPYFAAEFGLKIAAVIEREPGSEPSARELAQTIEIIRKTGIKAIFSEPQYPSLSAQTIVRETDAKVYVLDPAVTGPDDAGAYLRITEKNLKTLQEALSE